MARLASSFWRFQDDCELDLTTVNKARVMSSVSVAGAFLIRFNRLVSKSDYRGIKMLKITQHSKYIVDLSSRQRGVQMTWQSSLIVTLAQFLLKVLPHLLHESHKLDETLQLAYYGLFPAVGGSEVGCGAAVAQVVVLGLGRFLAFDALLIIGGGRLLLFFPIGHFGPFPYLS